MSSRRTLNKPTGASNPATKFLEWSSQNGCFTYYDKEKEENVLIDLPLKVQFLEDFHTIKGFDEGSNSRIYSNEIKYLSKEPLSVKSFKVKEPLAEGLYNDIKFQVKSLGGKYGKSVYALLDGEIVNIQLYGASIAPFIYFVNGDKKTNVKGHEHLLETNFVEVKSFADKKKGANKYKEPIFSIGSTFKPDEHKLADEKYGIIADYFKKYTEKEIVEEVVEEESDELAF